MLSERLQKIARSFGARAGEYDRHATLQKDSAAVLASLLPSIKAPDILELGCGTGFVTEHLINHYPDGQFLITDIAPEMIARCAEKYARQAMRFSVMDGQAVPTDHAYDLIVIGMAAQWFADPPAALHQLTDLLKPGGVLIYSAPGDNSFTAWKDILRDNGLRDGLLPYPAWPGIVRRDQVRIDYGRVENFLKSLKEIGAHQPREGYTALHPAALRQACRAYNKTHGGTVSWEIVYGVLQAAS